MLINEREKRFDTASVCVMRKANIPGGSSP